eukprot:jgi/Psemu1/303667/fgenesh1_kg.117_\
MVDRTADNPIGGVLEYSNGVSRKGDNDVGIMFRNTSTNDSHRLSPESSMTDDDEQDVTNEDTETAENQFIQEYLYPLVNEAEDELGIEIPTDIVEGIYRGLQLKFTEGENDIEWDDFEEILEEACQGLDEDSWFDIQEAFFNVWET